MLERLRKMSPEAKRKVGMIVAGTVTILILLGWILHSFGAFSRAFDSTYSEGVAIFSFLDENVQKAYDAFSKNVSRLEIVNEATTTSSEIDEDELMTEEGAQ